MHKAGESENLFQEGVCGRQVKIRLSVPKKTVQNDKDLAGGSPVGNVTQEAPRWHLAVMSPGCCREGSWEARGWSPGTCSRHSVSVGSESRAGREAEVRTGPPASAPDKGMQSQDTQLLFLHFVRASPAKNQPPLPVIPPPAAAPGIPAFWAFCLPHMAQQHLCFTASGWWDN